MTSHAIFQYNVLAIDDTHNTWTNMIVKMTILRLLGSSGAGGNRSQVSLQAPVEPTVQERASVHWPSFVPETMSSAQKKFLQHRFNRRCIGAYHRCNDVSVQEKILSAPVEPVKHRCKASVQPVVSASAVRTSTATSVYE